MYFRHTIERAGAITDVQCMNINEAHEKLGHGGENLTRKAAKELGTELTRGNMKLCK
jgi:hypothetical protein